MIFWEFSNQAAAAIFSIKLGMREVYSEPIQNISRNTRSRIGCFYFHIIIFNNKQRLHLIIKMFAIKFFILSAPSNSSMLRALSSFWGFFLVDVLYKGAFSAKAYPPLRGLTPDFHVIFHAFSVFNTKMLQIIDCKSLENYQENVYDGVYFIKVANL